jgi:hypothetical protein
MTIAACAPITPTPGVVVFNSGEFLAIFPEFTNINSGAPSALQNNFNLATLQLDNSCCSRVSNANTRQSLLYLLTAHITALAQGTDTQPASGTVGRVASATEGSVSAQLDMGSSTSQAAAYYQQTTYGAQFWQATVRFRTFYVAAAPRRNYGPFPYFNGPGVEYGNGGGSCGGGGYGCN